MVFMLDAEPDLELLGRGAGGGGEGRTKERGRKDTKGGRQMCSESEE